MKPIRKKGDKFKRAERKEFDQHIVDLARVTRVTEGGKHLSFRACIIIGDRKGRVGFGVAKGKDVQLAVEKAMRQAKKNLIKVPLVNDTIPHTIISKYKAAKVLLKPAPVGSGVIAGGAVRVVLELAGVLNISSKIMSRTKNKIAVVKATFKALESFKKKALPKEEKAKEVAVVKEQDEEKESDKMNKK